MVIIVMTMVAISPLAGKININKNKTVSRDERSTTKKIRGLRKI
jgi:hypothetical protein